MTEEEYITLCKLLGKLKFAKLKDAKSTKYERIKEDIVEDIKAINRVFKNCNYCENKSLWISDRDE